MLLEKNLRRARQNRTRNFFSEIDVTLNNLCHPVFIKQGLTQREEIPSMPGVYSNSIELALEDVAEAISLGIKHIVLRPVPTPGVRDVPQESIKFEYQVVQEIRSQFTDITILVDGYFGQTRSNGYYGPRYDDPKQENKECLAELCSHALAHAEAGSDFVISLGRIDNSVTAIRDSLDQNGFSDTAILSYAINFSSTLAHAMMRNCDAVSTALQQTHLSKIPVTNINEAIEQATLELAQGADVIGVKPATVFCDAISKLKEVYKKPVSTYIVSKEYAMVKAGSMKGWVSEEDTAIEYLYSLRRSGANRIFSYWAKNFASYINQGTWDYTL